MRATAAVGSICCAAALLAAPSAGAAVRHGTDRSAKARYTLSGKILTVKLLAGSKLRPSGRRALVGCGDAGGAVTENRKVRWPRGRRTLRVTLEHDVSSVAVFCAMDAVKAGETSYLHSMARMR
jgi:hypothetical protein